MNPETPEADAVEQAQQTEEVPADEGVAPAPWDADPADLADQQREVPADDEYDHE